jgi:hypothetical protein
LLLRCRVDGLLLPAYLDQGNPPLIAFDGEEGFAMEPIEALHYELVKATSDEMHALQRPNYRLLRQVNDFHE